MRRPKNGLSSIDKPPHLLRRFIGRQILIRLGMPPYHDIFSTTVTILLRIVFHNRTICAMPPGFQLEIMLKSKPGQVNSDFHTVGNIDNPWNHTQNCVGLLACRHAAIGLDHKHHILHLAAGIEDEPCFRILGDEGEGIPLLLHDNLPRWNVSP